MLNQKNKAQTQKRNLQRR